MQLKSIMGAAALLLGAHALAGESAPFKDRSEQESYAIGAQTGRTLKADKGDIDVAMLIEGLKDGLAGNKLRMSEDELRAVMSHVQQELHNKMVLSRRAAAGAGKPSPAK